LVKIWTVWVIICESEPVRVATWIDALVPAGLLAAAGAAVGVVLADVLAAVVGEALAAPAGVAAPLLCVETGAGACPEQAATAAAPASASPTPRRRRRLRLDWLTFVLSSILVCIAAVG
jgi:hypothetical protein